MGSEGECKVDLTNMGVRMQILVSSRVYVSCFVSLHSWKGWVLFWKLKVDIIIHINKIASNRFWYLIFHCFLNANNNQQGQLQNWSVGVWEVDEVGTWQVGTYMGLHWSWIVKLDVLHFKSCIAQYLAILFLTTSQQEF
jgi:hypothetical protein